MPIVPKKVSVYGDDMCIAQPVGGSPISMSRAQRIAQNPKFNGYNDYSRANNTALAVLTGYLQGQALYGA